MNYAKDRRRVQYFERAAKTAAGVGKDKKGMEGDKENSGERDKGRKGVTMERRRKVRVPMVEGNEYAGTLELIVEGEEVLLVRHCGYLDDPHLADGGVSHTRTALPSPSPVWPLRQPSFGRGRSSSSRPCSDARPPPYPSPTALPSQRISARPAQSSLKRKEKKRMHYLLVPDLTRRPYGMTGDQSHRHRETHLLRPTSSQMTVQRMARGRIARLEERRRRKSEVLGKRRR